MSSLSSRRNVLQHTGTLFAAALAAPGSSATQVAEAHNLDLLARQALEGSPIRLNDAQLQDLKHEIESVRTSLAKIRAFHVPGNTEPAAIFRAR